jgi:glycosyltransferase involved in cell wall biosynthesis
VRPIFHEKNIGAYKNYVFVHNQALGDYVAHMDGDDYALPDKLQTQADYLDADPLCAVVWHRMNVFDDAGRFCVPNLPNVDAFGDGKVYLQDLLELGSISYHSSTMYRSRARTTKSIENSVIDWYYNVEFLMSGYGKYLEQILGGYRYNSFTGITRARNGCEKILMLYISHLKHYLILLPQYRCNIIINCILHFLVELKNLRPTMFHFLRLAWESKCSIDVKKIIAASKRFRRINPGIL